MKTFQLICLKCGSQDVGIKISLETAGTTYECGGCGNSETGDETDLMAVTSKSIMCSQCRWVEPGIHCNECNGSQSNLVKA